MLTTRTVPSEAFRDLWTFRCPEGLFHQKGQTIETSGVLLTDNLVSIKEEKTGLWRDTKASSQACVRKQNSSGQLTLQVLSDILCGATGLFSLLPTKKNEEW